MHLLRPHLQITGENVATADTTSSPARLPVVRCSVATVQPSSTQNAMSADAATYTQSENLC